MIFGQHPDYVPQINNETYAFVLLWFVENVNGIYDEFKQKGIPIVTDIRDAPWGIREFAIRDMNGYHIRVSEGIAKG